MRRSTGACKDSHRTPARWLTSATAAVSRRLAPSATTPRPAQTMGEVRIPQSIARTLDDGLRHPSLPADIDHVCALGSASVAFDAVSGPSIEQVVVYAKTSAMTTRLSRRYRTFSQCLLWLLLVTSCGPASWHVCSEDFLASCAQAVDCFCCDNVDSMTHNAAWTVESVLCSRSEPI